MKPLPQSIHCRVLSWNSIGPLPSRAPRAGGLLQGTTQAPDPGRRGGGHGPERRALGPVPAAPWPWNRGPNRPLVQIPALLLSAPLPGQRLLCATLVSRLQIERMLLDILDDIFLLNLTLETAEGAFDRFAVLYLHFSH